MTQQARYNPQHRQGISAFSETSRPAAQPTSLRIQSAAGTIFPGVNLSTHFIYRQTYEWVQLYLTYQHDFIAWTTLYYVVIIIIWLLQDGRHHRLLCREWYRKLYGAQCGVNTGTVISCSAAKQLWACKQTAWVDSASGRPICITQTCLAERTACRKFNMRYVSNAGYI